MFIALTQNTLNGKNLAITINTNQVKSFTSEKGNFTSNKTYIEFLDKGGINVVESIDEINEKLTKASLVV